MSDFLLVMVKTGDADDKPYQSFSMIIVPTDTPGVNIVRDVPTMGEPDHRTGEPGGHAEIKDEDVRVPFDNNLVGQPGIWQGLAAMANVNASQEIHDSTMRLNNTWGELIAALRAAADTFEEQEEQSRAAIASISNPS